MSCVRWQVTPEIGTLTTHRLGHTASMDDRDALAAIWPLFGLVVPTPRVQLRYPTDAGAAALAALTGDIHDRDRLPFVEPWSLAPDGERERNTLQYHWAQRATMRPEDWTLLLVVLVDGVVVGAQDLRAVSFAKHATVSTGSWLHRPRQGQGVGTEMRRAVLHLAFDGLGADRAQTSHYDFNLASRRVTERLGYRLTDKAIVGSDAVGPREEWHYALDRDSWAGAGDDDITIVGLDACRELLGA